MINITESKNIIAEQNASLTKHPFLDLLFRSHFVLAALASIVSLFIWLSFYFHGSLLNQGGISPLVWHTHEMIFSFASTVVVGFILTAAQTWTGQPSIRNEQALFIILLWLFCHTLFWLNTQTSVFVGTLFKGIWWLLILGAYSRLVFLAKNRRNYLFIPLLTAIASLNIAVLTLDQLGYVSTALHLSKTAVLLFTLLIAIVGGRVIPFFTASATKVNQVKPIVWLDYTVLILSLMGISLFALSGFYTLPVSPSYIMLCIGTLHLIRSSRWCNFKLFSIPLLWSLHISYYFMALGLIAMGLSYFDLPLSITLSQGIHMITLGAVGLMILSMMSRVSLGHTGRMLQPKPAITFAFILMVLATIARGALPTFGYFIGAVWISALLWCLAFCIFIYVYLPILTKARLNGI